MTTRKLILIKHTRPEIVENVPARDWRSSEEGRRACGPLAEAVRGFEPGIIITSDEPKAQETGRLVADALGKPLETAAGLHEHDRGNVPMMRSGEFLSALATFFKQPGRLVLGRETADEAAGRFDQAIQALLAKHAEGNIAVVTHGTVLALFASENGAGDPFTLYRQLGLPSIVVFSVPDYRLIEKRERIGNPTK
jgi:broad specificity phosphatase PhoE